MPKGLRKLHTSVGEHNLTHFGGIFLIHAFCKKLKLKWLLQKKVSFPHRSSRYHPSELILAILYAIIAGIKRLSRTKILHRWTPLSRIQERLGDSRVFLQTSGLERRPPVCGSSPSHTRKTFGATYFVYSEALCLPCVCHQSASATSRGLVLLQRPRWYRDQYQTSWRRFCLGQNPDQEVSSKRSVFLSTSFCLQHYQLTQTDLFASEVSEYYITNHSHRTSGSTCETGQVKEQERAQVASRVSFGTYAESDNSEDNKSQTPMIFSNLLN